MPTHEGSILTAPGPSTRTLPSTNAATSELVVPKSIPIIRSLIRRHTPWAPRHPDLRRAVHRAIPFVSGPVDREHGPLRSIESFLYVHRAHQPRIEGLAPALDRPDFKASQQIVQRLQAQPVTLIHGIHHFEGMADAFPTPSKDAIPENGLHFFARSGGFGAAQQELAKFQQAVEHFLAAAGFAIAPQGIAELFEGAGLQLDFLGEGGERGPHAIPVHGGFLHAGFVAGEQFPGAFPGNCSPATKPAWRNPPWTGIACGPRSPPSPRKSSCRPAPSNNSAIPWGAIAKPAAARKCSTACWNFASSCCAAPKPPERAKKCSPFSGIASFDGVGNASAMPSKWWMPWIRSEEHTSELQ